jgi:hypothetical protein
MILHHRAEAGQFGRKLGLLLEPLATLIRAAPVRPFDTFQAFFEPTAAPPSMSTLILIPARMASTRLPGKPLADIAASR